MYLSDNSQNTLRVGIPRAMLYYRYHVLWDNFFSSLGVEVVTSRPTDKRILERGSFLSIDEACLSTKIFLGHVDSLIGKCDVILVPHINNFGMYREMCTKFEALYDLSVNVFRHTDQKFISYHINDRKKETELKAFVDLGVELGFTKKESKKAYLNAKKIETAHEKKIIKRQTALLDKKNLKIVVASHSYILHDAYMGKPVTDFLLKNGIIPLVADHIDTKVSLKRSTAVSKTLKWQISREIVGGIDYFINSKAADGVILLSAFHCGPDSITNEIVIRHFKDVPILNIVLDDQSGTAGLETRLESFIDILRLKKGIL